MAKAKYKANVSRPKVGSTRKSDSKKKSAKVSKPMYGGMPNGGKVTGKPMYGSPTGALAKLPGGAPKKQVPQATPMDPRITAWKNSQIGALSTQRNNALTDLTQQAGAAASEYGFNIKTDAQGNPIFNPADLTVNPQDPFSKMALLQKSYQGQQRGTLNGYAGQGQLNSGAYQRMVGANTSHNNQDKDALAKAFQDVINGIKRGRQSAVDTYNQGVGGVGSQALEMALGG